MNILVSRDLNFMLLQIFITLMYNLFVITRTIKIVFLCQPLFIYFVFGNLTHGGNGKYDFHDRGFVNLT